MIKPAQKRQEKPFGRLSFVWAAFVMCRLHLLAKVEIFTFGDYNEVKEVEKKNFQPPRFLIEKEVSFRYNWGSVRNGGWTYAI